MLHVSFLRYADHLELNPFPTRRSSDLAQRKLPENPAEALEMPTVEIVGTTPLPGLGTPTRDVPANVQIYTSKDLAGQRQTDRKSTRLNSSHRTISYAVFCLKKKKKK